MQYDYLIVGAGLFGAIFAHEATAAGKKCLVIDKRSHIAGNIYTEDVEGIAVHRYGAHIFHTNNKEVWDYVNRFAAMQFKQQMQGKDPQKIVEQMLADGQMSQQQFEQLKQQAEQFKGIFY